VFTELKKAHEIEVKKKKGKLLTDDEMESSSEY